MEDETKPEGEFDHIVAAGKHARAKHHNSDGSPLTEAQKAAILSAEVKAIIDGKFDAPEPEPTDPALSENTEVTDA